jgi:hypothetical protein
VRLLLLAGIAEVSRRFHGGLVAFVLPRRVLHRGLRNIVVTLIWYNVSMFFYNYIKE